MKYMSSVQNCENQLPNYPMQTEQQGLDDSSHVLFTDGNDSAKVLAFLARVPAIRSSQECASAWQEIVADYFSLAVVFPPRLSNMRLKPLCARKRLATSIH